MKSWMPYSLTMLSLTGGIAFGAPANSAPIAPSAKSDVKQVKQGEFSATSTGVNKQKLTVGKFDPPAAFNLEDIQNFPEERLTPVLGNPINFEEGRDFSTMMDFQDEQLIHPWLPEITKAPYLVMRGAIDKPAKDWTFAVIDQAGTPVATQEGKGSPPVMLTWNGEDSVRDHAAVDTVYIPQLATSDREGYHHTYMGQPVQFSSLIIREGNKVSVELSSKRIFQEKKMEFSKEAPILLDKVCDAIRETSSIPFTIQPYDSDSELATSREQALAKYFANKLYIPIDKINQASPAGSDKRGSAMAILLNGMPGSATP